jgi:hypothetical protein
MTGQINYPNMLLKYERQLNRAYRISLIANVLIFRASAGKVFFEQ